MVQDWPDQKISGFGKEDETGYDQGWLIAQHIRRVVLNLLVMKWISAWGVSFLLLSFSWIPGKPLS